MKRSCIVLLSGGLDSLLSLKLMTMQGIEAVALHSVNCFHGTQRIADRKRAISEAAAALGAKTVVFPDITSDVIAVTKLPRHGYGRHLNACIDCRLRTLREGFAAMRAHGADFVVTGEVVGQRPMSQRKDAIALADRMVEQWGFPGRILRPLCAKLLGGTVPEREGWVDPELLFDISGRSRDRQMALAERVGLTSYPSPAGGCLLTDPGFSRRLAVLAAFTPEWGENDVELLKIGRHFQIAPDARVVVARREEENFRLRDVARPGDRLYINADRYGAIALLRGVRTAEGEAIAAGLAVYYSKMREVGRANVSYWHIENGEDVHRGECGVVGVFEPDCARRMELELAGDGLLKALRRRGRLVDGDASSHDDGV